MAYRAVLERWSNRKMLYICELFGCSITADNIDDVMARAHTVITDHIRWLEARGIHYKPSLTPDLSIVEEGVVVADMMSPVFSTDTLILSDDEIDTALQVGIVARDDLLNLYLEANERQREYKHTPSEWSASEILFHVAQRDMWFITRLEDARYGQGIDTTLPNHPADALMHASSLLNHRVVELAETARAQRFETDFEEWTLRKMLRRRTAHLRRHYPQMLRAVRQRMVI